MTKRPSGASTETVKRNPMTIAPEYAQALCDAHEIEATMMNEEERELLRKNAPELYYAYVRILQIAYPADARWTV